VAQNVEKKNVIHQKLVKIRAEAHSDCEDIESEKSGGDWCIQQTEGQKHSTRIKILNAVKRNQNFDEKYEETREDR
jgi:hypothetical protein